MPTLTLEEAKRHVREAVAEHPTRRNPVFAGVCQYDSPLPEHVGITCIVGEVLKRAGLPLPSENVNFPDEGYSWPDVLAVYAESMELDTALWLGRVQGVFDRGMYPEEWADALTAAEKLGVFG